MSLTTAPRRPEATPEPPPEPAGRNLLAYRPVARLLRSRWYPGVLQWAAVAVFAVVVYQLLLGPDSAHDNLGTALVWVLWWPLIPIIFVALGRFWCAVCPFGKLSDLVQRLVGAERPGRGQVAVAFVQLVAGASAGEDDLRAHCAAGIADLKVPARIVVVDSFPSVDGPNGTKIRKADLRARAADLVGQRDRSP